MTDVAEALGSNIVVEDAAPAPPLPPGPPVDLDYIMAPGEQFSREQYRAAGWSDEQLLATGRMSVPPAKVEVVPSIGMPNYVWIILDDNDDIPPSGLFLGHNGTGFMLQTGVPAHVPEHLLGVLDDAIMQAPILDDRTKQVIGFRPRPRYTYRRVPAPTDA